MFSIVYTVGYIPIIPGSLQQIHLFSTLFSPTCSTTILPKKIRSKSLFGSIFRVSPDFFIFQAVSPVHFQGSFPRFFSFSGQFPQIFLIFRAVSPDFSRKMRKIWGNCPFSRQFPQFIFRAVSPDFSHFPGSFPSSFSGQFPQIFLIFRAVSPDFYHFPGSFPRFFSENELGKLPRAVSPDFSHFPDSFPRFFSFSGQFPQFIFRAVSPDFSHFPGSFPRFFSENELGKLPRAVSQIFLIFRAVSPDFSLKMNWGNCQGSFPRFFSFSGQFPQIFL